MDKRRRKNTVGRPIASGRRGARYVARGVYLLLVLAVFFLKGTPCRGGEGVRLERIRIGRTPERIRVVLDLSGATAYRCSREKGGVFRIDLPGVVRSPRFSVPPLPPGIRGIRVTGGHNGDLVCRIRLDPRTRVVGRAFLSHPDRLYVDFGVSSRGAAGSTPAEKRKRAQPGEQGRPPVFSGSSEEQAHSEEARRKALEAIRKALRAQAGGGGIPGLDRETPPSPRTSVSSPEGGRSVSVPPSDPGGESGFSWVRAALAGEASPVPAEGLAKERNAWSGRISAGGPPKTTAPPPRPAPASLLERRMEKARFLFKIGNYREAGKEARRIAGSKAPDDLRKEALYLWARCVLKMAETHRADYRRVVDAFGEAYVRYPQARWAPDALLQQGVAYFKMDLYYEALGLFQRVTKRFPGTPAAREALFWMGEASYRVRRYKEAEKAFERIVRKYPDSTFFRDSLVRLAECLALQHRHKEADRIFKQVLERWPDSLTRLSAETMLILGKTLRALKRPQKAAELFLMAINLHPASKVTEDLMWELSRSYDESGETDKAVTTYALLSELFPQSPRAYEARLKIADLGVRKVALRVLLPPRELQMYEHPLQAMRSMAEEAPASVRDRIYYQLASSEVMRGRYRDALRHFHRLMTRYPESPWVPKARGKMVPTLRKLVLALKERDDNYSIVKYYEELFLPLGLPNNDSFLLFNLAESYAALDLPADAVALARRSLKGAKNRKFEERVVVKTCEWEDLRGNEDGVAEMLSFYLKRFPKGEKRRLYQLRLAEYRMAHNHYSDAASLFLDLIPPNDAKKDEISARAAWLLGKLYLETDLSSSALHYVALAKRLLPADMDEKARARFLARCDLVLADELYRRKSFELAGRFYRKVADGAPEDSDRAWAVYRCALLRQRAGDAAGYERSVNRLAGFAGVEPWSEIGRFLKEIRELRGKLETIRNVS